MKRIVVAAVFALLAVALALFQSRSHVDTTDASFTTPGSWAAIPSALPGMPTVTNQLIPAIAPADGDGSNVLYGAFCNPVLAPCPDDPAFNVSSLLFVLEQACPIACDPSSASFAASGTQTLLCPDGALCDWSAVGDGSIIVQINGGGVNEVVRVVQCENTGNTDVDGHGCPVDGDKRETGRIIFVDTILAVSPSVTLSPYSGSLVSYRCDSTVPPPNFVGDATDEDGIADPLTLEDLWNFSGPGGMNIDFLNLGGGPDLLFRDQGDLLACAPGAAAADALGTVTLTTDLGLWTVQAEAAAASALNAAVGTPLTVGASCPTGSEVTIADSAALTAGPGTLCDIDFAPNGVVSYRLSDNGAIGAAHVTARQDTSGGRQDGTTVFWLPPYGVSLYRGCNLVAIGGYYYSFGTPLASVSADVLSGDPRFWFQRDHPPFFDLFHAQSTERSNVLEVADEAGFICVDEDTVWARPECCVAPSEARPNTELDPPRNVTWPGGPQIPLPPHALSGAVTVDGAPATPGLTVHTLIEPYHSHCWQTTVTGGSRYVAYVLHTSALAACGVEGDTISLWVDGYPAQESFPFKTGGSDDLDLTVGRAGTNDNDGDGCTDVEEWGREAQFGGMRDPTNFYDFYDITNSTLVVGARDKGVSGFDLSLLVSFGGTLDNGPPNSLGKDYDDDSNANTIKDGLEIDYASIAGPASGPDGAITGFDLSAMVNQGGDSCTGPP